MVYTGSTSCDDRATRGSSKGKIMVNLKENAREENELKRLNDQCIQYGKPPHYDSKKAKENIIWEKCLTYEEAYESVFGEAMEEFNAKQKRNDRKTTIEKELAKLEKGKVQQELIHSMVVQVGNEDNAPSKEKCIEILTEYREQFIQKFPNMKVVSCSIHLDETTPHLQMYFIPVKTKEQHLQSGSIKKWNGMDIQPSLTGALEQMGYTNEATMIVEKDGELKEVKDYRNGAMAQWQKDFNGLLDEICKDHDIEIDHYMRGKKVAHKDTLDYYNGELQEKIIQAKEELVSFEIATQEERETLLKVESEVEDLRSEVSSLKQEKCTLEGQIKELKNKLGVFIDKFSTLLNKVKNRDWKDIWKQRQAERAISTGTKEKETVEDFLNNNGLTSEIPVDSIGRFIGATNKLEELDEEWERE